MSARFYAPDAEAPGAAVSLPDEEAQHLARVLRLARGDAVRVFNGRGAEFDGVVEAVFKRGVVVRLGDRRDASPEARVSMTLAQAVLKGDKMDAVVRDAVMMGAAAIQPVVAARSEVTLASLERSRRRERWERIAISSAKQCGRAVVPTVREARAFDTLLDAAQVSLPGLSLMFVEPGAAGEAIPVREIDESPPRDATLLIGPEGGWSSFEIERGGKSCRMVTLAGRTLRADAMAVVALAALFTRWGEF